MSQVAFLYLDFLFSKVCMASAVLLRQNRGQLGWGCIHGSRIEINKGTSPGLGVMPRTTDKKKEEVEWGGQFRGDAENSR